MKKFILVTLCAAMVFMGTYTPTEAREVCQHSSVNETTHWEPTGYGYNHTYTGRDGMTHGCGVTIVRKVRVETCRDCGFVKTIYTEETDERHSTDHT